MLLHVKLGSIRFRQRTETVSILTIFSPRVSGAPRSAAPHKPRFAPPNLERKMETTGLYGPISAQGKNVYYFKQIFCHRGNALQVQMVCCVFSNFVQSEQIFKRAGLKDGDLKEI